MLHKKNTGYLKSFIDRIYSSLGTDNHRQPCKVARVGFSGSEAALPRSQPWAITGSVKHVPGFREGTVSSSYIRVSQKSSQGLKPRLLLALPSMFLVLNKELFIFHASRSQGKPWIIPALNNQP